MCHIIATRSGGAATGTLRCVISTGKVLQAGLTGTNEMVSTSIDDSGNKPSIIVKKYANRRLYNTETSSYITLETLARLTREGRDFKVVDAKTDEDITHGILTQIIMDEESRGSTLLPASFLRHLIGLYGDSMQGVVPQYLEASMDAFRRNQAQFRDAMKGAISTNPFAELAKRNLAVFEAATGAFVPKPGKGDAPRPVEETSAGHSDEIGELKAQIAELQAKVDKLGH